MAEPTAGTSPPTVAKEVIFMKLVSAFVVAALGGIALSGTTASAAPIDVPVSATGLVVPAGYVCNEWGHCWHRHYYRAGYYHPYWRGYGYRGWHHPYGYWHRRWGYGYRWRHWHQW
jgi:hypothetical protein